MPKGHHRQSRMNRRYGGPRRKWRFSPLTPGADPALKRVFGKIGIPKQSPFVPDPYQTQALEVISHSDCLVTAPTGSGKTWIAEQVMRRVLQQGGRIWYASPLKALTNAKYEDFSALFGKDALGILTGDRKENPDAPIIVGTTEILRNQLYDSMYEGTDLKTDFVILDEAHFLGDLERGVVWEEVIIYLPPRIPLLLLSATIGNPYQIADWLSGVRQRPCQVVEETRRPVPLHAIFLHPSGTLMPLLSGKRKLFNKVKDCINGKRSPLLAPPRKLPPMGQILDVLRCHNLLPAIFFLKSRADCDQALTLCEQTISTDPQRESRRLAVIEEFSNQYAHIGRHRQLWELKYLAVASHHSGQLPMWKLLVENLMTQGLLNAVFATTTVAAGVNFPARTVVFFNSDRFNGVEFLPLTSTEFHQMTGRAGRRGMDNIGFAVAVPGKYMDIRQIAQLVNAPPAPVFSQIRINFSMVLNLLLSHDPDQIEDLLTKSFATYLITKGKKKKAQMKIGNDPDSLVRMFRQHLDFLIEMGYATENGRLTDEGIWASRLRVDQPLLIAEGFRRAIFPDADPALLASVIGTLVHDRETDDHIDARWKSKKVLKTLLKVYRGLKPFVHHMQEWGFDVRPLYLRPALSIYGWAMGVPWEEVVKLSQLEEGNLAMLILRTADNLRHIRSLADVFPEAANSADRAIELLLREPVVVNYSTD